MKILTPIALTLALAVAIADAKDPAAARPTCAVLNFGAGGEAAAGDAGMLANMVSVKVAASRKFSVIPRYKVNRALAKTRFSTASYSAPSAAALAAGRMLNVDFVIFGSLSRNIDKNEASAMLLDVRAAKVTDRVTVAASGDAAAFRAKAAGEIAMKLAGQSAPETQIRQFARIEPEPEEQPITPTPPAPKPAVVPRSTPSRATPYAPPVQPENVTSRPSAFEPIKPWSVYLQEKTAAASAFAQHYWKEFSAASAGRLDAGLRYRRISLHKETDESFLGSINTLDLENDGIPAELFATWYFNDYVGAEASWFNLRARTVTNPEGFSDGAICVSGPTFAIAGKYREHAPWVPFVSAGIGFFSAEFDHQDWWQYAYGSVEDWQALGSPSFSMSGKTRNIELDDTRGRFLVLGISYQADERWSAELAYRRMSLSVDSHYTITLGDGSVEDRGNTNWPLDNSSWLIGARYSF